MISAWQGNRPATGCHSPFGASSAASSIFARIATGNSLGSTGSAAKRRAWPAAVCLRAGVTMIAFNCNLSLAEGLPKLDLTLRTLAVMNRFSLFCFTLFCALAASSQGYFLEGQSWVLDRSVVMQLSLGGPRILTDGSATFNDVAVAALSIWNSHLTHLRFVPIKASPVVPAANDDAMSVAFSSTVFGDSFGTGVLAVTTLNYRGSNMEETDTQFNNSYGWDSYRGPLNPRIYDFRRVAIHEFGHTLGLDHPDQANPKQNVVAIMNAHVGDLDTVAADDIAGVNALYGSGPAYRTIPSQSVLMNISTRGQTFQGNSVLIGGFIVQGTQPAQFVVRSLAFSLRSYGVTNPIGDSVIEVHDAQNEILATSDDWFTSADASTISSYHLDPPNSLESAVRVTLNPGNYTVVVRSFASSTQPAQNGVALFELYDLRTSTSRAGNVSTRGLVGVGDNILIAGFILGGSAPKPLILRALGPTLTQFGVTGALADPTLELRDANGSLLKANDNWQTSSDVALIQASGKAPPAASEAAIAATLLPGRYTALVRGVNNTTGNALVEVYDQSPAP